MAIFGLSRLVKSPIVNSRFFGLAIGILRTWNGERPPRPHSHRQASHNR